MLVWPVLHISNVNGVQTNVPCGTPLTAPQVTTGGLCRWKAINKEGRHVGLDFYDLLIEGDSATLRLLFARRAKGKRKLVLTRFFTKCRLETCFLRGTGSPPLFDNWQNLEEQNAPDTDQSRRPQIVNN